MSRLTPLKSDEFDELAIAEMHKAIEDMRHGLLVFYSDMGEGISPRLQLGLSTYQNFAEILKLDNLGYVGQYARTCVGQAVAHFGYTSDLFAGFTNSVIDILYSQLVQVDWQRCDLSSQAKDAAIKKIASMKAKVLSQAVEPLSEDRVERHADSEEERRLWATLSKHAEEDLDRLLFVLDGLHGDDPTDIMVEELRNTVMSLVNIMSMLGLSRMAALIETCELHLLSGRIRCHKSWQYFVDFGRAHFLKPFDNHKDLTLRELALLQSLFRLVLSSNNEDTVVLEEAGDALWQEVSRLEAVALSPVKGAELWANANMATVEPFENRWHFHVHQIQVAVDQFEDAVLILDFWQDNARQLSAMLRSLASIKDEGRAVGSVTVSLVAQMALQLIRSRVLDGEVDQSVHEALASIVPLLRRAAKPIESLDELKTNDKVCYLPASQFIEGVSPMIGMPTATDLVAAIMNVLADAKVNQVKYCDYHHLMLQISRDVFEAGLLFEDELGCQRWEEQMFILGHGGGESSISVFQDVLESLRRGWQRGA